MKGRIFWGVLLTMTVIMIGCTSHEACEPVVIVTNTDYTYYPLSVPYSSTHDIFANAYSGADLSVELRGEIIESMWHRAEDLNEDPQILFHCIQSTYPDWHARPNRVPCYAEKCRYEGEYIWAIAFNRANSFEEPSLSHFDLYFVSYATYETLYYTGCFGTD
ncbi:MAG: hypothetical protein PVI51_03190 [candidate division WOR-3 bacterium]|jgi:hypothetical protein